MLAAVLAVDLVAMAVPAISLLSVDAFNTWDRPHSQALGLVLPVVWLLALQISGAHDSRTLGAGHEEFGRLFHAALLVLGGTAVVDFAFRATLSRGLIVVAVIAAGTLNALGRVGVRALVLQPRARRGQWHQVVVVGTERTVLDLTRKLRRATSAGMHVVGYCLTKGGPGMPASVGGIDVIGTLDDLPHALSTVGATAVVVTNVDGLDESAVQRLSWQLEGTNVDLFVVPALNECAVQRMHVRSIGDATLLHVRTPQFDAPHGLLKEAFDRSLAALLLILLLPMMTAIAAGVRLSSKGPALFRQVRVGRDGSTFTLYKYRSMQVDAEAQLASLLTVNECADGLLFKVRNDPRVTSFGAWLRRYSLDELPQLLNVLKGEMSLVGPRPPLPTEVEGYGQDVRRRLLVKPGLTGLWQIKGRSNLPWEESIRLDLYYVENWSLSLDLLILSKTMLVVLRGTGAY